MLNCIPTIFVKLAAVTFRHTCWPLCTLLALPIVSVKPVGLLAEKLTVPAVLFTVTDWLLAFVAVLVPAVTCVEPLLAFAVKHTRNKTPPEATVCAVAFVQFTTIVPGVLVLKFAAVMPATPKLLITGFCNIVEL